MVLNYIEESLILGSALTGCVSISAFASLIDISIGIKSSAVALRICEKTVVIKKCRSLIKKKRKGTWSNSIASKN